MLTYIGTRVLQLIPLLLALSMIIFIVIELPPGDYLTMYVLQLEQSGTDVAEETIVSLTAVYGLDKPWRQRAPRLRRLTVPFWEGGSPRLQAKPSGEAFRRLAVRCDACGSTDERRTQCSSCTTTSCSQRSTASRPCEERWGNGYGT